MEAGIGICSRFIDSAKALGAGELGFSIIDSWSQLMQEMKLTAEESGFNINSWSQLRQEMMLGAVESGFTMNHGVS